MGDPLALPWAPLPAPARFRPNEAGLRLGPNLPLWHPLLPARPTLWARPYLTHLGGLHPINPYHQHFCQPQIEARLLCGPARSQAKEEERRKGGRDIYASVVSPISPPTPSAKVPARERGPVRGGAPPPAHRDRTSTRQGRGAGRAGPGVWRRASVSADVGAGERAEGRAPTLGLST